LAEGNNPTAVEKLRKARIRIMTQQPFFASLVMLLKPIEDESIGTAATDSKILLYAPSFIEKLSIEEVIFVYLHEIMHCTLGHIWRQRNKNHRLWNIATDYAINDILHSMEIYHYLKMPPGVLYKEKYAGMSAEEIYDSLKSNSAKASVSDGNGDGYDDGNDDEPQNHGLWKNADENGRINWQYNTNIATKNEEGFGNVPAYLTELIKQLKPPQKDWRTLLNEFVQEEINDFSLMPPDNRFDGDFFIFSFSDTTEVVKDILFFVDTSGSMLIKDIEACYSEINGALQQFNRQIQGKLGFFDAVVYEPLYDFAIINDIKSVRPIGRGGTSFFAIFEFLKKYKNAHNPIAGVIILTDGQCTYKGITAPDFPVLWVFTTHENNPPFGLYTTIEVSP